VHRLTQQLGRILLLVMERKRLGDGGRVPSGVVGSVRVEGGVSPGVHEGDAMRE